MTQEKKAKTRRAKEKELFLKISGEPGLPDIKAKNLQERPRQKQSPNVMSTNY